MKCYNYKTKDSQFSKMEDRLLAEAMPMFVVPLMLPYVIMVSQLFGKITITKAKVVKFRCQVLM
jgi:hypothetical protein